MSVRRLRDVLAELLWDAPEEVGAEIQRAVADQAVKETLEMYQLVWREYKQAKELPGQENWPGLKPA